MIEMSKKKEKGRKKVKKIKKLIGARNKIV